MDGTGFEVAVIPTTLKDTTLGNAKAGEMVNIETDMIVKIIKKQLAKIVPAGDGITIAKLKEAGF